MTEFEEEEKKLIQKFFDEVSRDSGKYCFGVDDTFQALELGAVETLILWERLDITRFLLKNTVTGSEALDKNPRRVGFEFY